MSEHVDRYGTDSDAEGEEGARPISINLDTSSIRGARLKRDQGLLRQYVIVQVKDAIDRSGAEFGRRARRYFLQKALEAAAAEKSGIELRFPRCDEAGSEQTPKAPAEK